MNPKETGTFQIAKPYQSLYEEGAPSIKPFDPQVKSERTLTRQQRRAMREGTRVRDGNH